MSFKLNCFFSFTFSSCFYGDIAGTADTVVPEAYSLDLMNKFANPSCCIRINGSHDPPRCFESTAVMSKAIREVHARLKYLRE